MLVSLFDADLMVLHIDAVHERTHAEAAWRGVHLVNELLMSCPFDMQVLLCLISAGLATFFADQAEYLGNRNELGKAGK